MLLLIVTTTLGVLVCGWVVSRLPTSFSAQAEFQRYFRTDVASIARTPDQLLSDLFSSPAIISLAEQNARITNELDRQNAVDDLRSRILLTIEPFASGGDLVSLRVVGSNVAWAREMALRLTQIYVESQKNTDTYRENAAVFSASESKFQQAEAEWNAAQAALRELEAEQEFASGDVAASQLNEIRNTLSRLSSQRDRLVKVLQDPVLRLPTAPALVHPARCESPSILSASLERYIQRREELAATYTEQHPAVVSLDRKIAQLQSQCAVAEIQTVAAYEPVAGQVPTVTQADRALIERKIADCETRIAELAAQEAELAAQQEGWRRGAEGRWLQLKQQAEAASRDRMLATHHMAQASDAIRNAERQQTVHYTMTETAPAVRFEGWDRRKWYVAVLVPWLTAMSVLTRMAIRRKGASSTKHMASEKPTRHSRPVFQAA